MGIRWERVRLGNYHGFGLDGDQVAQIANVNGPAGVSVGWQVWLSQEHRALDNYLPDQAAAQAAAEEALGLSDDDGDPVG